MWPQPGQLVPVTPQIQPECLSCLDLGGLLQKLDPAIVVNGQRAGNADRIRHQIAGCCHVGSG